MTDLQLAIKALAQQWEIEGRQAKDRFTKRDCDRQIFALEILCVRLGYETLEVDLELARAAIEHGATA